MGYINKMMNEGMRVQRMSAKQKKRTLGFQYNTPEKRL